MKKEQLPIEVQTAISDLLKFLENAETKFVSDDEEE